MYVTHLNRNRAFYIPQLPMDVPLDFQAQEVEVGSIILSNKPSFFSHFVLTFEVVCCGSNEAVLAMAAIFRALIKFCPGAGYYYVISFNSNVLPLHFSCKRKW